MSDKSFSIKEALQFGWDTLLANFSLYLKLLALLVVLILVPGFLVGKLAQAAGVYLGIPLQFLLFVWQSILSLGIIRICLKLYDKQSVEISDLWSGALLAPNYILTKLLFSLIIVIGFILLIIPGMVWMMQFYMSTYLVIDRGAKPINALKASSAVTYGAKWDLGVFTTVAALINLGGFICLGIGIMISLPVTLLASVHVYRTLLSKTPTVQAVLSS